MIIHERSMFVLDYERLKDLRKRCDLSCVKLSYFLENDYGYRCSATSLYKLENCSNDSIQQVDPRSRLIVCLADLYNVDIESLYKKNPSFKKGEVFRDSLPQRKDIQPQTRHSSSEATCAYSKHSKKNDIKEPVF